MIDASTLSKVLVDCRLIGLQAKEVGTVMGLLMKHEVINELTFREGIMLAAAELPDEDSPDPSASPDSPQPAKTTHSFTKRGSSNE